MSDISIHYETRKTSGLTKVTLILCVCYLKQSLSIQRYRAVIDAHCIPAASAQLHSGGEGQTVSESRAAVTGASQSNPNTHHVSHRNTSKTSQLTLRKRRSRVFSHAKHPVILSSQSSWIMTEDFPLVGYKFYVYLEEKVIQWNECRKVQLRIRVQFLLPLMLMDLNNCI